MHDDETRSNHDEPTEDLTATQRFGERPAAQPGKLPSSIGKYRILSKLGEGGMGVVYEAEQLNPKRKVAVKVVRGGQFVDEQRIRMFQREADTLALLKHPNIGGIHESGRTEDGQHFFAMELVRGQTLDVYMETRPPIVDAHEFRFRLALLRKIANAVHYAHGRGVIHRDLKPSNIVVTSETASGNSDDTSTDLGLPEIKILDFGLARITEADGAASSMVTQIGTIKGTLPYMSPEQARGNPQEIDVRTDVYSLGVILYEMLSGHRPYDVMDRSVAEAVRVICDEAPRSLSATISGMRRLDRDVETIVGKALEKEADRRYLSAAALAEDIGRYLAQQPIVARPPSTLYQLRKFAQRNKVLVGGVAATFAVLIAGVVVSTVQRQEAIRQRDRATTQEYVANIGAAESSLRLGELAQAKRRLEACPPELRGWEWFYFAERADQSLATLRGHEGQVQSVAFSPDGTRIVSGSGATPTTPDHTVRIWDAGSGELLKTLVGHEDTVFGVAFSPDGLRIASSSVDKTVRLWDAASGELVQTLRGHEGRVWGVDFGPDGARIASNSEDGTVRIWDAASGELLQTLRGPDSARLAIPFFSQDGLRIVYQFPDFSVQLWDAASGERLTTLSGNYEAARNTALSPDGARIALGAEDETIRLWDTSSGELVMTLTEHEGSVTALTFSPDGTRIASGSENIRLWDPTSGELVATLTGHESGVRAIAFSPDGKRIASGSWDKTIRLWDAASDDRLSTLAEPTVLWDAAVSRNGNRIASASEDGHVRLWDTTSGEALGALMGHGGAVNSVAFSPDGSRIASGSDDGHVRLWDTTSGIALANLTGHQSGVESVAFSPDGARIVSGSYDKTVRLWDAISGQPLDVLTGHTAQVLSVAFSPNGERIASGAQDKTVRLWNGGSGEPLLTLTGHDEPVLGVAFSPDGTRVVSASFDGTARLWEVASGGLINTLAVEGPVLAATFSPDGKRIVTGSDYVRVWDVDSGELLATLRKHGKGQVNSVAFSRDGTFIVSASLDGIVRLWRGGINSADGR